MCLELKILRRYLKKDYTIGRLFVDDRSLCDTLEDPVRDLKVKERFTEEQLSRQEDTKLNLPIHRS